MTTRFNAAVLAGLLVAGCTTEENANLLLVRNTTRQPIAVFAYPDGSLIDPVPFLPPGSFEENLVRPAGHLGFNEIPGFEPDRGVYLLVYVVQRQGAEFVLGRTVTARELRLLRNTVTIDLLPSPRYPL